MTRTTYTILLPNEKAKTYRYITLFVLLINFGVFSVVWFNTTIERIKSVSLFGAVLGFAAFIFFLVHSFTKKFPSFRVEISFILLSLCWFIAANYLLAFFMLSFAVLGFYTNKKFMVIFSDENVTYPSFPPKTYQWSELSNVILKDNVLTIDLKNNKLIQAVIEKQSAAEINEIEFNQFCTTQLARSN